MGRLCVNSAVSLLFYFFIPWLSAVLSSCASQPEDSSAVQGRELHAEKFLCWGRAGLENGGVRVAGEVEGEVSRLRSNFSVCSQALCKITAAFF